MHSFTRTSIAALRTDINAALKVVADKHGLIIQLDGSARFSPNEVTFSSLKAIPNAPVTLQNTHLSGNSPNGVTNGTDPYNTLESREYLSLGYLHGLKKEWLGKTFFVRGTPYKIVGLKNSYRKYPVIGVGPQGGRYKFPSHTVIAGIR